MRLSKRAGAARESETLKLSAELARLRREGKDVVNLLEGEADLPAPMRVKAATAKALRADETRYSNSKGLPELRALLARNLPKGQDVLVTNGAKQALYTALQTLCGPGDEAIVLSPYWVTFPEAVRLAGARPVFVPVDGEQPDPAKIAAALTRRTKALILNTPNNPTGAVYSADVLRELARLAKRRDFFIVSDEAYEGLVFDGLRHVGPAELGQDAARRTITIKTFSKSYSMTGFRVGYLAAAPEIVKAAATMHGHCTGNVCTFVQRGAIAALGLGPAFHARRRAIFQKRRDLAYAAASRLFGCAKPSGGFFVFPDVGRFLGRKGFKDSAALAEFLLKKAGVAVVPGSACGREGHLRVSFSSSERNIKAGFARIEKALCR